MPQRCFSRPLGGISTTVPARAPPSETRDPCACPGIGPASTHDRARGRPPPEDPPKIDPGFLCLGPALDPDCPGIEPKSSSDRPDVDPGSTRSRPQIERTSTLDRPWVDPQIDLRSAPNPPRTDPKSTRNWNTHRPQIWGPASTVGTLRVEPAPSPVRPKATCVDPNPAPDRPKLFKQSGSPNVAVN